MKSEIVGVVTFFVILGCSASKSLHKGEKQKMDSKQEKICLLAISKLDSTLLEKLSTDLEKTFEQQVEVTQTSLDLEFAYNPEREQYFSSAILERLPEIGSEARERVFGIVDVDLYPKT